MKIGYYNHLKPSSLILVAASKERDLNESTKSGWITSLYSRHWSNPPCIGFLDGKTDPDPDMISCSWLSTYTRSSRPAPLNKADKYMILSLHMHHFLHIKKAGLIINFDLFSYFSQKSSSGISYKLSLKGRQFT